MPLSDPSVGATDRATRLAPLSTAARPELTGGRAVGVLLLHGFTGSPAAIRPWAEALARQGYAVEVPLLPGHGTTWRELNRTTWTQWYAATELAHARLADRVDVVVVGGLSLGATLALLLAARCPSSSRWSSSSSRRSSLSRPTVEPTSPRRSSSSRPGIAGVVSLNVSLANRDPRRHALPVLKRVVGSFPGIVDDIAKPDVTELGYDRLPLRAAHSVLDLFRTLRPELGAVTQPLLVLRSVVDHVADPGSHRLLLGSVSSRDVTEVLLHDSFHVATLDHDADRVVEATLAFLSRLTAPAPAVTP